MHLMHLLYAGMLQKNALMLEQYAVTLSTVSFFSVKYHKQTA